MIEKAIYTEKQNTDSNGYQYITVDGDDYGVRTYTLKNGLKVFLAQNFDAPRIQTYIPVRTGSNNDPADNTGLSHYLEHMMFKGTAKIGTRNWEKEKPLLDEISDLFEEYKAEENPEKKKEIYRKIDAISQEASHFAIANEYDKCLTSLGAVGTNAHTWLDETVYKNNIPNNELEKWLIVEKERFTGIALRLFHTELESIYEEFNRAQDNDSRLTHNTMMELLFPKHPNGQQTTLGKAEHLKNPSMKALQEYFSTYYVPNNYAIVLVGDLQFEETIALVDKYFGALEFSQLPEKEIITEEPMTEIVSRVVKSPSTPRLHIAWRTDSYGTRQGLLAEICSGILTNSGSAGLLDLNINNAQTALFAESGSTLLNQYGFLTVVIVPKENQTLDDAKILVLNEIEKIKNGDFPDWMVSALINDYKLSRLKELETADGLATGLYQTYIRKMSWCEEWQEFVDYQIVTKDEVVAFAREFFKENYAIIYKEMGENENLIRVENPNITPVKINRDDESEFFVELQKTKFQTPEITPEFIDYQKEISTAIIGDKKLSFVKNKCNEIAQLYFIFPLGTDHDKELSLAIYVLPYLGTETMDAAQMSQEFYKIGVNYDAKIKDDQMIISLTGLEENLSQGIDLMNDWFQNVKADEEAFERLKQLIFESREMARTDKTRIKEALYHYAQYGEKSRFRDSIPRERILELTCREMVNHIKNLFNYPYQIFLYGTDFESFKNKISETIRSSTLSIPEPTIYPNPETKGNVFFVNYDMVQMEMYQIGKVGKVNPKDFGKINVFNEYFGAGLSSVVFQEIRESKSLAYAAYVSYVPNKEIDSFDYVSAYIGTQPDKLGIAVESLNGLMSQFPEYEVQFQNARTSVLKKYASGRITRTNIFFNHHRLRKLGIDYDLRKDNYEEVFNLDFDTLRNFYQEKIKNIDYNIAIIGKRENLNIKALESMGTFVELSLDDIFL